MKNYSKKDIIRQRVLAVVALAGLFACGLMVGLAVTKTKTVVQKIETVAKDIVTKNSLPDKTCSAVEKVLEAKLQDETDTTSCGDFLYNVRTYEELIVKGCPENKNSYTEAKDRSFALANASCDEYELRINAGFSVIDTESICATVREEMLNRIDSHAYDYNSHIDNAKIYAIISERGCTDESAHYKELAEKELAVARAITDDKLSEHETIEVVETYKKLQMQAAAQEMFDKAKRLTNPAIDFILEVEKIINE